MRYHYDHYESLKISREEMCGVLDTHGYRIRIHIPERMLFSGIVRGIQEKSAISSLLRKSRLQNYKGKR